MRCPFAGPLACPVALSQRRQRPLWNGRFRRITPGAHSLNEVVQSIARGPA